MPSTTVPPQNSSAYVPLNSGLANCPAIATAATISTSSTTLAMRSKSSNCSNASPDIILRTAITSAMAAAPDDAPEAMKRLPSSGSVAAQSGRAVIFNNTPVYPAMKKPAAEPTIAYSLRGRRLYKFAKGANLSFPSATRLSRNDRKVIAPKINSAHDPNDTGDCQLMYGPKLPVPDVKNRFVKRVCCPRSPIRKIGQSSASGNA